MISKNCDANNKLAGLLDAWRMFYINKNSDKIIDTNLQIKLSFEEKTTDLYLCLLYVYISLQTESFDNAQNVLNKLSSYKNYFKINEPKAYLIINYLSFILGVENDEKPEKFVKLIEDFDDSSFKFMLLGDVYLRKSEEVKSIECYEKAYKSGNRSSFLYIGLLFLYNFDLEIDISVLIGFLKWAILHFSESDEKINKIIEKHESVLTKLEANSSNFNLFEGIYDKYKNQWALAKICELLIEKEDYSLYAFGFYEKAILSQISVNKIYKFYIYTSYKNGIEDVKKYAVEQFLRDKADFQKDVNFNLYIYYLMLKDYKYFKDVGNFNQNIVHFLYYCIENNINNKYFVALSKHVLAISEEIKIDKKYIEAIEKNIYDKLFFCDINIFNDVTTVAFIKEKEYTFSQKLTFENKKATFKCLSDKPEILFFSNGLKKFVNNQYQIVSHIGYCNCDLLIYFYKKYKNDYVSVALSKYFMENQEENETDPLLVTDILTHTLSVENISYSFKMQISATLGNILYERQLFDKALKYYENVDENCLNDMLIEKMLNVFINVSEYKKATELIVKKSHLISDSTLFKALKKISQFEEFSPFIAGACYELLLKSWYDKNLLNITLKYYKGCSQEWHEISKVLAQMSASNEQLDEVILKNAIWMHKFDIGSQKVFKRMFENSPQNEYVGIFAYYIIYEIFINDVKPEYDAIDVLEKLFKKHNDRILAYALTTVYLTHNIKTLNSDEIILNTLEIMENEGFYLPIAKTIKDKKFINAYVVKNRAFVYRTLPNKKVVLNIKPDDYEEYIKIPMKYFRFGLYFAKFTHFYNENLIYYFSEEQETGSIATKENTINNNTMFIDEKSDDVFFQINNCLCFEQMFKYEQSEKIITQMLEKNRQIRAGLM